MKGIAILLILFSWTLAGCPLQSPSLGNDTPKATWHIFFIDVTGSIREEQIERWIARTESKVFANLRCGDRVTFFPIHEQTAKAGAFFEMETPIPQGKPVRREKDMCNRIFEEGKTQYQTVLESAYQTGPRAQFTDILGVIQHLQSDKEAAQRKIIVYVVSDFIHETREMNLKQKPLEQEKVPEIVTSLVEQYKWNEGTLENVRLQGWSGQSRYRKGYFEKQFFPFSNNFGNHCLLRLEPKLIFSNRSRAGHKTHLIETKPRKENCHVNGQSFTKQLGPSTFERRSGGKGDRSGVVRT